jgi:hypothetical protein
VARFSLFQKYSWKERASCVAHYCFRGRPQDWAPFLIWLVVWHVALPAFRATPKYLPSSHALLLLIWISIRIEGEMRRRAARHFLSLQDVTPVLTSL